MKNASNNVLGSGFEELKETAQNLLAPELQPTIIAMIVSIIIFIPVYCIYRIFYKSFHNSFLNRYQGYLPIKAEAVNYRFMEGDYNNMASHKRDDYFVVTFEYVVDGKTYHKKLIHEGIKDEISTTTLYYNPKKPKLAVNSKSRTVQEDGVFKLFFGFIVPFAFFIIIGRIVTVILTPDFR